MAVSCGTFSILLLEIFANHGGMIIMRRVWGLPANCPSAVVQILSDVRVLLLLYPAPVGEGAF